MFKITVFKSDTKKHFNPVQSIIGIHFEFCLDKQRRGTLQISLCFVQIVCVIVPGNQAETELFNRAILMRNSIHSYCLKINISTTCRHVINYLLNMLSLKDFDIISKEKKKICSMYPTCLQCFIYIRLEVYLD